MGKLLKIIFFSIFTIILLIIVGLIAVVLLSGDSSKDEFDTTAEYRSFETIIGEDLSSSLTTIKETNYNEDNNKITIKITEEELNNYLVSLIRENINSEYLISNEYVKEAYGIRLNSLFFHMEGDVLSAKFRVDILNVYKTSLTLAAKISIDENRILNLELVHAKLGKGTITITTNFVKNSIKKLKLKFNETAQFDPNTFTFKFDINKILEENCKDELLSLMIKNCPYDVFVSDSKLNLVIDTKDLFMDEQAIDTATASTLEAKKLEAKALAEASLSHDYSLTITENEFNYMIQTAINESISSFEKNLTIGNSNIKLQIKKMYLHFDNFNIKSNLYTNDCATPLDISFELVPIKLGEYVNSIYIKPGSKKLGNINATDSLDIFTIPPIPLDTIGFEDMNISDINVNKTDKTITFTGVLK